MKLYYDSCKLIPFIGQHNDARMNLAIALTAAREGAKLANHVEVLSLIKEKDIVKGVHVRDQFTGNEWNIFAKVVVNATGMTKVISVYLFICLFVCLSVYQVLVLI